MADDLVAANERAHEHIDEAWMSFVERILEADYRLAGRDLRRFMGLLDRHMTVEESSALVSFRASAGPGDAGVAGQVEGDHVILRRTVAAVARLLEDVAGAGSGHRRLLAERLGELARVSEVLAHHSQRERERFYPLLDASLDADARARLCARLRESAGGS